ncbi:MAG: amino acid ABC transporter ATP-binding protein [Casimicrobiaceae bacterium]
MPLLALRNIRKQYGSNVVLDDVSLDVEAGEVVAVIGRSGSGKTTLLRCINGLEKIDAGTISFDDKPLPDGGAPLRELRRHIGIVFQSLNLFPHHSVERNITLGPTVTNKVPLAQAQATALAALRQVDLEDKLHAYPAQLSGGQQQRVAIARALAMQPRMMLFDEITSALDPELVGEVVKVLERLAASNMTMVLVTHEMGFARRTADTLVFMHQGRVWEKGPPKDAFARPQTKELESFIRAVVEPND